MKNYGGLDILVADAAVWDSYSYLDVPEDVFDKIVDTDLKGAYFIGQAAARHMAANKVKGKIVFVSSAAHLGEGPSGIVMNTFYQAAKAGVVGMTRGIACELKQYGISVNCVAPGGMLSSGVFSQGTKAFELYGAEYAESSQHTSGTPLAMNPDMVALVPFDLGRLYFLSDNGCVSDMYLIGIGRQDVEESFEYYHDVDNGEFSVLRLAHLYSTRYPSLDECIRDGSSYRQMQIGEYVAELGIKYSFGLGLWDAQGCLRCLYTLDRVCDVPFSQEEKETAYITFQHLNQLFQNLCLMPAQDSPCPVSPQLLTKIAALLVKGITPAEISKRLCISFATVNKHLANMHRKLHVATRQELIVHLHQMGYL